MKPELKRLLGRRVAPLLIVAGAVGLVLAQSTSRRPVEVVCDMGGLAVRPERVIVLAVRNGELLRRVEQSLGGRSAGAESKLTIQLELSEGPVQLTLLTAMSGAAAEQRAVGLLEVGAGRNVVLADLGRGTVNLVVVPE